MTCLPPQIKLSEQASFSCLLFQAKTPGWVSGASPPSQLSPQDGLHHRNPGPRPPQGPSSGKGLLLALAWLTVGIELRSS